MLTAPSHPLKWMLSKVTKDLSMIFMCMALNFIDEISEEFPSDRQCWFYDDDDCRVTFVYGYDDEGEFVVRVQKTKECPPVLNILGIILGVIGAVVAIGFALLLLWKLFTVIHDRREFARFEKERQMAKWDTVKSYYYLMVYCFFTFIYLFFNNRSIF